MKVFNLMQGSCPDNGSVVDAQLKVSATIFFKKLNGQLLLVRYCEFW